MKSDRAENFFSPAEQERIRLAVSRAESSTSGEIATMVVARSDSYREAVAIGAMLGGALAALVIAVVCQQITIWTYLPLAIILFFPARLLLERFPQLCRPFIAGSRLHEAVQQRAVRAFYEKGLHRTSNETGILIFISLFEHKVWILGDRGINSRIQPEAWQQLALKLSAGIRGGDACDTLCAVIASCGTELARHFPRLAGDVNELQDGLLL